jgi:hypothetical protein
LLDSLITSKTRVKLILKFFLNPETRAYLRGLSEEFGESTNGIRVELNRLADAGLLEINENGRTKEYSANKKHPLFPELHSVVKKYLGIDKLIDNILAKLGNLELAFITGDYAHGMDSGLIDLVIVGEVNKEFLQELVMHAEELIKRKIRYLVLSQNEFIRLQDALNVGKALLVWGELDQG